MSRTSEITVEVSDEAMIDALKKRGYDVFQQVPQDWSAVGDNALGAWWIKLRNWSTDVAHRASHEREKISAEIERRNLSK